MTPNNQAGRRGQGSRQREQFGVATMRQREATERRGMDHIERYLRARPETIEIRAAGAEDQRGRDIDLFWTRRRDGEAVTSSIEVKVDTQGHATGNYALETISNEEGCTSGCFMRTEADLFFYYFVESHELHIIQVKAARDWFVAQMRARPRAFPAFETFTSNDDHSLHYCTIGRLVPIRDMQASLGKQLRIVNLAAYC